MEEAGMTPESLEDVYRTHWADLVRLAAVVTGDLDAAPEIVQEVFVEFVRDADTIRNPAGWLRTAVVHRSRSWVRRRITRRQYLEMHGREHAGDAPDVQVDVDVRRALARLNPDQRAAVFLRHFLDLPVEEIATLTNSRVGTVKSRLSRAHSRMEEMLRDRF